MSRISDRRRWRVESAGMWIGAGGVRAPAMWCRPGEGSGLLASGVEERVSKMMVSGHL